VTFYAFCALESHGCLVAIVISCCDYLCKLNSILMICLWCSRLLQQTRSKHLYLSQKLVHLTHQVDVLFLLVCISLHNCMYLDYVLVFVKLFWCL